MKILFIHTFYSPDIVGGAEVVLQSLAEGAKARGIEVAILTTTDKPGLHQDEVNGIRVWRAGLRNLYWHKYSQRPNVIERRLWHLIDMYNPLMKKYIRTVVSIEKPTVASVHNLPGFSISAWSALQEAGIPIVQVLHDHYLLCPANTMYRNNQNCKQSCTSCKMMRLPHKSMSQDVSGVVGVSNYLLNRHMDAGYFKGVTNRRVIYNTRTPQELGITEDAPSPHPKLPLRFGFIGSLTPVKGIELLLETYTQNSFPVSELLVAGVGDNNYVEKLKRIASGQPVRFLGRVAPCDFYPHVDIVIIPSLWNEPLGTVIMEAMIFGKPVIASNTGGSPEMIVDGVNGILFNPKSPHALLIAMKKLFYNPDLASQVSEEKQKYREKFMNRTYFLDQHLSCYTEAQKPC